MVHRQRPLDAPGELPLPRRRGCRADDKHQEGHGRALHARALRAHALGLHAGGLRLHGRRRGRGRQEGALYPPVSAPGRDRRDQVPPQEAGPSRPDLGRAAQGRQGPQIRAEVREGLRAPAAAHRRCVVVDGFLDLFRCFISVFFSLARARAVLSSLEGRKTHFCFSLFFPKTKN